MRTLSQVVNRGGENLWPPPAGTEYMFWNFTKYVVAGAIASGSMATPALAMGRWSNQQALAYGQLASSVDVEVPLPDSPSMEQNRVLALSEEEKMVISSPGPELTEVQHEVTNSLYAKRLVVLRV